MKAKLIKVDDVYRLVEGTKHGNSIIGTTDLDYQKSWSDRCQKLSIKNCEAIERSYDLDELAKEANGYLYYDSKKENKALAFDDGYRVGFQKALELMGDKKFSEDDIKKAIEIGEKSIILNSRGSYLESKTIKENYMQSLQQTEWDVEIEMEYVGECNGNNDEGCFQDSPGHNCGCFERRPKLDADGCLILKRINL